MTNMTFAIFFGFCFMFSLIIVYTSKERINNKENQIYKVLIFSNIVGLVLQFLCDFVSINYSYVPSFLSFLVLKSYLFYFIFFAFCLCEYLISISFTINKKNMSDSITAILTFLSFLCILILPISLYSSTESNVYYSYGPAVVFTYALSAVISTVMGYLLITKFNKITAKKAIPILIFIISGIISMLIQMSHPELIITCLVESLICFVMYFTIENPDVRMIEQLEVAKESADRANNSKTEFLSSMSHEIRTPLNAIVGFSDCIVDANSLVEAKENAKDIVNASQTLLEIVNGILDISKIEAGKMEIVNTKYNAREVFTEVAKLITPRMKEKGLDFTYMIDPSLPATLFGDKANIKKIVTNFLSNACKYTDRGFVRYEVHSVKVQDYCRLIISVEDSGRGIKKESVDKLFNRFQRLDEDRNTTIEGTGLGLAITKQLTELMGGKVIVHTVYGQGSKFTAVINQKIESMDQVEETVIHTDLNLEGVKILIVDDAPLNLKVASKLMQKYGADNIDTCSSGFECIKKIQNGEKYDIIFMDDMMPKMSGIETFSKLKQIPHFHTPTIALTANAITGMREKYLSVGFNDYLAKPMDQLELVRVCNEMLGREDTTTKIKINEIVDENEDLEKTAVIPVPENIEQIIGAAAQMEGDVERETTPEEVEVLDDPETTPETSPVSTPEIIAVEEINLPPLMEVAPIEDVPVSTSSEDTSNTFDRSYLESKGVDVNKALEMLGDMDMYNATMGDFVSEVEEKWHRLEVALQDGKMEDYAIDVHSLKSDCKYLGFMSLADIAYDHELKSKENNYEYVKEHFEELRNEYNKVLEIAKTYAEHNKSNE